jgi:hypothetical protein
LTWNILEPQKLVETASVLVAKVLVLAWCRVQRKCDQLLGEFGVGKYVYIRMIIYDIYIIYTYQQIHRSMPYYMHSDIH